MLGLGTPARAAIAAIVAPPNPCSANTDSAAARIARSLPSLMLGLAIDSSMGRPSAPLPQPPKPRIAAFDRLVKFIIASSSTSDGAVNVRPVERAHQRAAALGFADGDGSDRRDYERRPVAPHSY